MKVPKKNVSRMVSDIRGGKSPRDDSFGDERPLVVPPKSKLPKIFVILFVVIAFGIIVVSTKNGFFHDNRTNTPSENGGISAIWKEFQSRFLPFLKGGAETYGNIVAASQAAFTLLDNGRSLGTLFPQILMGTSGDLFVGELQKTHEAIGVLLKELDKLSVAATSTTLGPFSFANELAFSSDLHRLDTFLNTFVPWISSDTPHHVALFFYNSAELRPGGGFLGSMAEVTLTHGAVSALRVRDINEIDRTIRAHVVPPKPLQRLVTNWRSADANWFFDFPASASKTLSFMESSSLYHDEGITFDVAIALSPRFIADLLALTGSISLPGGRVLTSDNVLDELQRAIQEAQARGEVGPKDILKDATPQLIQKIAALQADKQLQLLELIRHNGLQKEIMVYARVPEFERLADYYGVSGTVYQFPQDFEGDYLALVAGNVAGGKSDVFMKQDVTLEATIDVKGLVHDHLTIRRVNSAKATAPWWYRVPNDAMLQIFVPPRATVNALSGGGIERVSPTASYASYGTDPDLNALESTITSPLSVPGMITFEEAGKRVLATWVKTLPGARNIITLDYQHRLFASPKDGGVYQFVLEKQSGTRGSYHLSITSPVGYVFKENNLPVYEFSSDDISARTVIALTFKKID